MDIQSILKRLDHYDSAIFEAMSTIARAQNTESNARYSRHAFINSINFSLLAKIRGSIPQKTIAKRAGVAQPVISMLENSDTSSVSMETLKRILRVYASLNATAKAS